MIEEDKRRLEREHRILVLGSQQSGKSTILKQMKIIHQDGFSEAELAEYTPRIYKDVLKSAQSLVGFMKNIGVECEQNANRGLGDKVLDFEFDEDLYFPPDIAEYIYQLWNDPIVPKILDTLHASDFYLVDSAPYFLDEIRRIASPKYLPTETDILRSTAKPNGIQEIRFCMGHSSIHMFNPRGLVRTKFLHFFDSVTSMLFCTSLAEYDEVLSSDSNQNRLNESLVLFESLVNSRWFLRVSIILLLNKIDVFKVKLRTVPLQRHFPDYTGGSDTDEAAKFILWKFVQVNRARLSIYSHLTQATDTANLRLVFIAVKETVLQNAIRDSGCL